MPDLMMWKPVVAPPRDRAFWLQDIGAGPVTQPLGGALQADVVIVGGGFTGLWTALRLLEAEPSMKVVILEAAFSGAGASGRNGGQVHSWFAEIDTLAAVVGQEEAAELCQDTADAIAELRQLQQHALVDMDLRLDGWLWTASSIAQEGAWKRAAAMTAAAGKARFEPLSAAAILERTGSSASYAGIVEADAGTVHPAKLTTGLRNLAISQGAIIHEQTPVVRIRPGTPCRVATEHGEVRAPKVVLAANAWLSAIPELRRHMYVVESQVIATAPVPGLLNEIGWRGGASICDSQKNVLYYQRTDAGRVIFGRGSGRLAYGGRFGADFNRSAERGWHNIRELHRVYPSLRGAAIDYDWTGPIDCVPEHVPVFGTLTKYPNVLFGMGFNGTGIAQTPIGGRILASLVLEQKDRWSESGLVGLAGRAKLPPEPLRYVAGRIVRQAVRRKSDAEILNKRADLLSRMIVKMMPGPGEH
jgi:glycine/D-amino acid oxidase-like deaminating enzyme